MSTSAAVTPGEPMSWEQFERLSREEPSEYVDGCLLMVPSPTRGHQLVCRRLAHDLENAVPAGFAVATGWAWRVGGDEFVPDVMVHPQTTEDLRFTGTPLLLVEVLSTNRADDLVRKTGKYAAAGAPHYWIVDPRERTLDAYDLCGGVYQPVAHVDARLAADVPFGSVHVGVDLARLLA